MGSTKYIQVNVNILTSLQLSQDNICELNVVPPQFRSAFSVYTSPDGTKYHLHSELVDDTLEHGNIISKCWLCVSCNNALMDNKIPKLSIAAGVDFGDPARIGLPSLTLTEEYLIAKGRLLVSIVKLVGSQPSSRQSAKRGHVISFPHNGPSAVAEREHAFGKIDRKTYPRIDGLEEVLFVSFVGSRSEWEAHLLSGMPGGIDLQVRSAVVYQWLHALKALNPLYKDINIDDSQGNVTNNMLL